jgi:hypothetical protein
MTKPGRLLAASLLLLGLSTAGLAGAQFLTGSAGAAGVVGSCATSNAMTKWAASTQLGCSAMVDASGVVTGALDLSLGVASTTTGVLRLFNAGSAQKLTVQSASVATSDRTLTLPDPGGSDSVVYLALAQTLTNKTFVAPVLGAATGTSFQGIIGNVTPAAGSFTTLSASGQITSTATTGTAPLVIASTTNVPNLNASSLNGATFAAPGAIGGGTAAASTFTTVTVNTRTGTPATFACFDSGGKLVESATACQ